ncbi:unnamed protein product [Aspergillus oryzae]|uniref:Unnamed protein product n=1 Tax=Aspergillus oryzae TaxID=5062 RepID=A0AAN4Y7S8_ASPOZ|nr:unnamed protein product [Aspergillus oryzae]GMF86081.1 unnamed protein product [Aspergillus oryzae]GMG22525.1 unnamed protein product [Aspergillus oryzae]
MEKMAYAVQNSTQQPMTAAQGANIAGTGDECCCYAPHYHGRGKKYVQLSSSSIQLEIGPTIFQRVAKDILTP